MDSTEPVREMDVVRVVDDTKASPNQRYFVDHLVTMGTTVFASLVRIGSDPNNRRPDDIHFLPVLLLRVDVFLTESVRAIRENDSK